MHQRFGRGLDWPLSYEDLRPFYDRVQQEVGMSGDAAAEVWRPAGEPYPMPPLPIFQQARIIARGFQQLGLCTSPLPLAINSAVGGISARALVRLDPWLIRRRPETFEEMWGCSAAANCRCRTRYGWRTTAFFSWINSRNSGVTSSKYSARRSRRGSQSYNLAGVLNLNAFDEGCTLIV
jgi:choline dehydrogenase-like flavoprotein